MQNLEVGNYKLISGYSSFAKNATGIYSLYLIDGHPHVLDADGAAWYAGDDNFVWEEVGAEEKITKSQEWLNFNTTAVSNLGSISKDRRVVIVDLEALEGLLQQLTNWQINNQLKG